MSQFLFYFKNFKPAFFRNLDRLDTNIKNFRNNAIKESIKRGFEEMGEHKLQQGDVQGALKFFSKSRDYCVQPQHVRTMCLNVIKASGKIMTKLAGA